MAASSATSPLGALTTISLNELMENQRITAGFQLPFDGSSSAYFLQYQNFTRRLDWGFVFLRRQSTQFMNVLYVDTANNAFVRPQLFKSVSTLVQGDLSYPFRSCSQPSFSYRHTAG
jgi:hypothetical protein